MPKDEFDFEDPLELNGRVVLTEDDTTDAMCECFIEEFMRMGYSAARIEGLFHNPHYIGMQLVWRKRGAAFVRNAITELFARWGRPVTWPGQTTAGHADQPSPAPVEARLACHPVPETRDDPRTDPMGQPLPKINL